MKSMRICPGCKAEYPLSFPNTVCRICKTAFAEQFCNYCKVWKPTTEFNTVKQANGRRYPRKECKNCGRLRKIQFDKDNKDLKYDKERRFMVRRRNECTARYKAWKGRLAKLPQTNNLTEDEWLAAVKHFNGCAICDSNHVETRQYFILFADGGKYKAYNIFPACGECSKKDKRLVNPFVWMDKYIGNRTHKISEEIADKLVAYLQSQIERVENNEQQKASGIQGLHTEPGTPE